MDWWTAAISDRATLRVLLENVRFEIEAARRAGALPAAAQVYVITESEVVRLRFNQPALDSCPTLGSLAIYQNGAPIPNDMVNPLIAW